MKWILLLLLPVLAFAAKGVLVDNLYEGGSYYDWDWPFSTDGGLYDWWIAFDYDPDGIYTVSQIKMDWVYLDNISCRDDMNFAIYLDDFDDPPIITFTVHEEDYTESDTGFDYVGRDVYRGDIPLGNSAFDVSPGNKYWIALQMDADEWIHAVGWYSIVGEVPWYKWNEGWQEHHTYHECSYALYDDTVGIKGASLGEIKALFR